MCQGLGPKKHDEISEIDRTLRMTMGTCAMPPDAIKIHQRGVQWKQGVVIYMMLSTSLFYNTTPIHCTPLPTAPLCNEYPSHVSAHSCIE